MTPVNVLQNLITSGSKHAIRNCVKEKERLKERHRILKIRFIIDLNTCIPSNGKKYRTKLFTIAAGGLQMEQFLWSNRIPSCLGEMP